MVVNVQEGEVFAKWWRMYMKLDACGRGSREVRGLDGGGGGRVSEKALWSEAARD